MQTDRQLQLIPFILLINAFISRISKSEVITTVLSDDDADDDEPQWKDRRVRVKKEKAKKKRHQDKRV